MRTENFRAERFPRLKAKPTLILLVQCENLVPAGKPKSTVSPRKRINHRSKAECPSEKKRNAEDALMHGRHFLEDDRNEKLPAGAPPAQQPSVCLVQYV